MWTLSKDPFLDSKRMAVLPSLAQPPQKAMAKAPLLGPQRQLGETHERADTRPLQVSQQLMPVQKPE